MQAFKANMGDKAAGVSDDMISMLAGQQMVSSAPPSPVQSHAHALCGRPVEGQP